MCIIIEDSFLVLFSLFLDHKKFKNQTLAALAVHIVQENCRIFHTFVVQEKWERNYFYYIALKQVNLRFCHNLLEKQFVKIIYYFEFCHTISSRRKYN